MRCIILACALAGILGAPAFAQGVDPLIGTWKFNPEKSTCNCPLPKSLSFTVVKDGEHVMSTVDGVDGAGRAFKFLVPHIYDGMPHPITGNPGYDSSTIIRIGNTYNQVRFKHGTPVEVMQAVIVPGKTITGTAEGITPNSQPYCLRPAIGRKSCVASF